MNNREQELSEELERTRRELDIEKKRTSRALAKSKRDAQRKTKKTLPSPWTDPFFNKVTGKTLSPANILAIAGCGLAEYGVDVGPPPNGMHGVAQKGTVGLPRITFEYWHRQAVDRHPGDLDAGLAAGAMRLEQKMDEIMLTAREHAARAFRILIYVHLVDLFKGDTARAQAEFPKYDVISYDPAAIDPQPILTTTTVINVAHTAPVMIDEGPNVAANDAATRDSCLAPDGSRSNGETKDAFEQDTDAALEAAAERLAGVRHTSDETLADTEEAQHG